MEIKTLILPTWKTSLIPLLFPENLPPKTDLPRIAIVGIGNESNGDEAIGVCVARALQKRQYAADAGRVLIIEANHAPENITTELRRFQPQVVILINAVQMDLPIGEIDWIPWEPTTGMGISSRNLPLAMLARYLTLEFNCQVQILGIQPLQNDADASLSEAGETAVDELIQTFCRLLFCR
jgi:hydrogenase 3 maturation protease